MVDRLGDATLPGAALAEQEDRRLVAAREELDLLGELAHLRRRAEEGARRRGATPLRDVAVHLPEARLLEGAIGDGAEVLQLDRLDEEVLGARLHRLHGERHVAVAGDHDDHRTQVAEPVEDREAIDVGEAEVEQEELGALPPEDLDPLLSRVGAEHLVASALEEAREGRRDVRFVVDDQNRCHETGASPTSARASSSSMNGLLRHGRPVARMKSRADSLWTSPVRNITRAAWSGSRARIRS